MYCTCMDQRVRWQDNLKTTRDNHVLLTHWQKSQPAIENASTRSNRFARLSWIPWLQLLCFTLEGVMLYSRRCSLFVQDCFSLNDQTSFARPAKKTEGFLSQDLWVLQFTSFSTIAHHGRRGLQKAFKPCQVSINELKLKNSKSKSGEQSPVLWPSTVRGHPSEGVSPGACGCLRNMPGQNWWSDWAPSEDKFLAEKWSIPAED